MTRTFFTLAGLITLGMLITIGAGLWLFVTDDPADRADIFVVHFVLGLTTALGILLVHCIIFTYFLGTGRWVKEVGIAYKLPDAGWPKLTRELKRATFPPALFAMLFGIASAASGAGAQLQDWHWSIHATLAFATLLVNLWAFRIEWQNVSINAQVIQAVLDDVDRIRAAQGLGSNAEALLQEAQADSSTQAR
jgi:hypothetical protein